MAPEHVLVPLDGSPLATRALEHALATYDCEVTVLNVVTPVDAGMSESGVLEVDEDRQEAAMERAERITEEARDRAADIGREVHTAVETGDPAETILAYGEEHDIDQIVMGGHAREETGLAERILGTVATTVVRDAHVTVTVVR